MIDDLERALELDREKLIALGADPGPDEQIDLCDDCPPIGYPTDKTRCLPCPRRTPAPSHA